MADFITIGSSLKMVNADPVDRRLVLTKAEMLAMNSMKMPRSDIKKYFCLCSDDNQFYVYDKDATANATTGKFALVNNYMEQANSTTPGLVMSSTGTNSITVNENGTMEVNQIDVSKLVNSTESILVLDGGSAPEPTES